MKHIVGLGELQQFANRVGQTFTKYPIKIKMTDIPPTKTYEVNMRSYWMYTIYPNDKRRKPHLKLYEILINNKYYNDYNTNLHELQQGIIHELAHAKIVQGDFNRYGIKTFTKHKIYHDKIFNRTAKELGADSTHQKQYWNDI
jgi:hypothetical protein